VSFRLDETSEGVDLVVTGDWSPEAETCLRDGRADGLDLNYARGFRERDLAFLTGLPVRRLHVLARTVKDLSPVYSLAETLVSLDVQTDPRATIELERLPLLRSLLATWRQVQGSVQFAQSLERLYLLSYTEADLVPLTAAPKLVSINMKDYPRVQSLNGVEDLPWLAELGIFLGKDLDDITALQRVATPVLTQLRLPSCRKVVDLVSIASCTALRFLDLSEGGDLPTVAPLGALKGLEKLILHGSTTVLDGDLSPIATLPQLQLLAMKNRRSYAPTVKEIQDAISRRR
jgi:hypothetical protein